MTRLSVALLSAKLVGALPLVEHLRTLVIADFSPFVSQDELLNALSVRHFDAVLVDLDATGSPFWQRLVQEHPALLIVCWGETPSPLQTEPRLAPVVVVNDPASLQKILQEESEHTLRGRLGGVSLPGLLQMLQYEQRSCRMRIRSGALSGELSLRSGRLAHASWEQFSPREAALEMLLWSPVDVAFERYQESSLPPLREPLDYLLLEAARLRDERQNSKQPFPSATSATGRLSSARWLLPPSMLGDSDALLSEVMLLPGATTAAVIDTEHRVLVALRQKNATQTQRLQGAISDGILAMNTLLLDIQEQARLEDVIVTATNLLLVLRPLRVSPGFVLAAAFARDTAPLGLVRAQITKLADSFIPGTLVPR